MIKLLKKMGKREVLMAVLCTILVLGQVYFDLTLPDYMTDLTMMLNTAGSETSDILNVGLKMLGCTLASAALAIGCGYLSSKTASGFSYTIREKLFNHVMDMGSEEMQDFSIPSLITRTTNDITQIQMIVSMGHQMIIKSPIMAVWAVIKILGKSWELSAVTAAFVVVYDFADDFAGGANTGSLEHGAIFQNKKCFHGGVPILSFIRIIYRLIFGGLARDCITILYTLTSAQIDRIIHDIPGLCKLIYFYTFLFFVMAVL